MWPDAKYFAAAATGLPALCGWMNRRRPIIVTYHGLHHGPKGSRWIPSTFIHIDDFNAQMEFFTRRCQILDPEKFLGHLRDKEPFPDNSLLVTFDDGYESFHRLGMPTLERLGIRVIVFVATEYVFGNEPFWYDVVALFWNWATPRARDRVLSALGRGGQVISSGSGHTQIIAVLKRFSPASRRPIVALMSDMLRDASEEVKGVLRLSYAVTPEAIREVVQAGHRIGGHTHTHTILSVLNAGEAQAEIVENRRRLEACGAGHCVSFAYPNGGREDFDHGHKEMLRRAGYEIAFSLTQKRTDPWSDPYDVSRYNVVPEDTVNSLSYRLSGMGQLTRCTRKVRD